MWILTAVTVSAKIVRNVTIKHYKIILIMIMWTLVPIIKAETV